MQTLLLAKDGPLFGINERGIILFGFEIYFYAICIVAGMLLAAYLSSLLMRRRNIKFPSGSSGTASEAGD